MFCYNVGSTVSLHTLQCVICHWLWYIRNIMDTLTSHPERLVHHIWLMVGGVIGHLVGMTEAPSAGLISYSLLTVYIQFSALHPSPPSVNRGIITCSYFFFLFLPTVSGRTRFAGFGSASKTCLIRVNSSTEKPKNVVICPCCYMSICYVHSSSNISFLSHS